MLSSKSNNKTGVNLVPKPDEGVSATNVPTFLSQNEVERGGGEVEGGSGVNEELPVIYPDDSASQVCQGDEDAGAGGEGANVGASVDEDMFSEAVKRWFQLDDEIKALGKAARVRRKEKREITGRIIDIMEETDAENVRGRDGILSVTRTKSKVPLTKENIRKTLAKRFTNPQQIEELVKLLTDERERVERVNLRRKKLKT